MALADLVFSGVNAETGHRYSAPRPSPGGLPIGTGGSADASAPSSLGRPRTKPVRTRGLAPLEMLQRVAAGGGGDPRGLKETGWGIVFAPDTPPEVEEALSPLLKLRRSQTRLFACLRYSRGDELGRQFLDRHGAGPGPADTGRVPYYLLLVGSPESLPFEFDHQLIQHAVGRLHFDHSAQYDAYARTVVDAEVAPATQQAALTLFGPSHPGDLATSAVHADLLEPLARRLATRPSGWQIDEVYHSMATRERLASLLGCGNGTPQILFSAGHGLWFAPGHPLQEARQGAVVCSGWSGSGPVDRSDAFGGDDLPGTARLSGTIPFLVGCFTIGTPKEDSFCAIDGNTRVAAPRAFVARLAQGLVGRKAGALAVVGHVDKAMLSGFQWPGVVNNVRAYELALRCLMVGASVGFALGGFSQRQAELATLIARITAPGQPRPNPDDEAALRIAHHDASAYSIFGDPAVRLNVRPHRESATIDAE